MGWARLPGMIPSTAWVSNTRPMSRACTSWSAMLPRRLCEWLRQGKLTHSEFLSAEYPVEAIQQALEVSQTGRAIKTLLRF